MAYSYKTSIAFGLVYIPITLHSTIKDNNIGFNLIDKKTKSRVEYKKTCVDCDDREVKNEDIVKGYHLDNGEYVIFDQEELDKLKGKKDKSIIIEKFVDLKEINPIYFDKTFYVVPENKATEKAYYLLKNVLEKENKVGIAKTILGSSECVVALWVRNDDLLLSRLFFDEEVQANPAIAVKVEINKKEVDLAETIVKSMTDFFHAEDYKDEYTMRIRQAILDKANGNKLKKVKEEKTVKITDLMEALKESVTLVKEKKENKKKKDEKNTAKKGELINLKKKA